MEQPAVVAAPSDAVTKQELVDRFARLKAVWLDLSSTAIERDELAAVQEELRLLGAKQSLVNLCTQRFATSKASEEALHNTLGCARCGHAVLDLSPLQFAARESRKDLARRGYAQVRERISFSNRGSP